ncbi:hypothetical protein ACIGDM_01055 [Rothia koreensis]|uniref:hypothetical protein n=1 Tax=Rothia koreensis TaxID=592378 RepID=UPI0037C92984
MSDWLLATGSALGAATSVVGLFVAPLNQQRKIINETQILRGLEAVNASYTARVESRQRLEKAALKAGKRRSLPNMDTMMILGGGSFVIGLYGFLLMPTNTGWQQALALIFLASFTAGSVLLLVLSGISVLSLWRTFRAWFGRKWHARRWPFPPNKAPQARRKAKKLP